MPYSTQITTYPPNHPNPSRVIEILIDGQPWGQPGDANFRFGNRICRMLLSCKPILKTFLETEGANPEQHNKTFQGNQWLPVSISVEGFSRFERQNNGEEINRPYLKFSCNESTPIGIGWKKAEGLLAVWGQLEAFATEVGMPPIGAPANIQDIFGV